MWKWYDFGLIGAELTSLSGKQTEMSHKLATGLDLRPPAEILGILAEAQAEAARAVQQAIPEIVLAAEAAAASIREGGRLVYAAAGSSGLMAIADALELPGTYGIAREQIVLLFAGGMDALFNMAGGPEDDVSAAQDAVAALGLTAKDCLIALTASGSTPYPLAAIEAARQAGARTIGMANNPGTPILQRADIGMLLPTPAEVVAGSTRMGAGTAQKIALNMLSTLMAIHLGHVHDGFMVNVVADNIKLRQRARQIVRAVTGVSEEAAALALEETGGRVKAAILVSAGKLEPQEADDLLSAHAGKLRTALKTLGDGTGG